MLVMVHCCFWWLFLLTWFLVVSGVSPWLLWVISGILCLFIVVSDYLWSFVVALSPGYFWLFTCYL